MIGLCSCVVGISDWVLVRNPIALFINFRLRQVHCYNLLLNMCLIFDFDYYACRFVQMPILNENGGLGILNGFWVISCLDNEIVDFHSFRIKYGFYEFLVDGTLLWYREKKE